MKISVTHELIVFLSVTMLGLAEGFLFDIFRAVRRLAPKSFLSVGITDVIYWLFALSLFAWAMFWLTGGELRGYMFIGIALGLLFHFLLLSDVIISIVTEIFLLFLKFFNFFLKILLTPARFLYKMVLVPIYSFLKSIFGKISHVRKSGRKNDKKTK